MGALRILVNLCLTAILGLFLVVPGSFASLPVKELLSSQALSQAPEREAVQSAIKKGKPLDFLVRHRADLGRKGLAEVNSPEDLVPGKPLKVFLPDEALVQALSGNKSLIPVIERCHYYWEVPVSTKAGVPVASFRVEKFQGEWQVVEIGGSFREKDLKFLADPGQIETLLLNHGIRQADAYAHFTLPPLHTDFLVIASDGKEYLIPLIHGGVPEAWGLKSGELYPREKVAATVGPVLKEMQAQPGKETGAPSKITFTSQPIWPFLVGGAFLAALGVFVFFARRAHVK